MYIYLYIYIYIYCMFLSYGMGYFMNFPSWSRRYTWDTWGRPQTHYISRGTKKLLALLAGQPTWCLYYAILGSWPTTLRWIGQGLWMQSRDSWYTTQSEETDNGHSEHHLCDFDFVVRVEQTWWSWKLTDGYTHWFSAYFSDVGD